MEHFSKNHGGVTVILLIAILRSVSSLGANCTSGELLEGPDCSSFYKCSEEPTFKGVVLLKCPPGTFFHKEKSSCELDFNNECPTSGPQPPAPYPIFGDDGTNDQPPGIVASPPGSQINNFPPPTGPDQQTCTKYEIDTSGVYDCSFPGMFPSYGDCSNFYVCINTMGCILKGFYVSCPPDYLYNAHGETCLHQDKGGSCPYVQDSGSSTLPKVYPVIQLESDNMNDFFGASAYWDYMPFLPNATQRIVRPTKPGDVARGGNKNKPSFSNSL